MKLSREQFEKLALEHLDMLYRIGRRLTHDHSRAEDLVQETYLRALKAFEGFDLQEFGIRPWLVRIMHNLHFSRSAREKKAPEAIKDSRLESAEALPQMPSNGSRAELFDGMDQQLSKAIEELPEEYQAVLILWAVDDLSYKEIALACDIPIGTVMSRLHRARQRLSEKLKDYASEQGMIRE